MNGEFAQSEENSPSPTSAAEMTGMDIGSPFSATPLDVHRARQHPWLPPGEGRAVSRRCRVVDPEVGFVCRGALSGKKCTARICFSRYICISNLQLAISSGGLGSQAGVVVDQLDVGSQAVAAGDLRHPGQEEGGGGFAVDALLPALGNGPVNGAR